LGRRFSSLVNQRGSESAVYESEAEDKRGVEINEQTKSIEDDCVTLGIDVSFQNIYTRIFVSVSQPPPYTF
jgi:hypothetical protein